MIGSWPRSDSNRTSVRGQALSDATDPWRRGRDEIGVAGKHVCATDTDSVRARAGEPRLRMLMRRSERPPKVPIADVPWGRCDGPCEIVARRSFGGRSNGWIRDSTPIPPRGLRYVRIRVTAQMRDPDAANRTRASEIAYRHAQRSADDACAADESDTGTWRSAFGDSALDVGTSKPSTDAPGDRTGERSCWRRMQRKT